MIRLLRLALGLVIAAVFASRMEAATLHCVQLAHESATTVAPAPACHMTGMSADHAVKASPEANHHKSMTLVGCECAAFTQSVDALPPDLAVSRIADFAWRRPEPVRLASRDLEPARPPPKA